MDMHVPNFEQVEEVQITKEEYDEQRTALQAAVAASEGARKLANIPEFKDVVMDGYLVNEPARLGSLIASGKLTAQGMESAVADLKAVGTFRIFLQTKLEQGRVACEELESLEQAWQEALAEEAGVEA